MGRFLIFIAIVLLTVGTVLAQVPLGDTAREARTTKAAQPKAKIVIDDEISPIKNKSPFPELNLKGLDNTTEIAQSIESFRKTHSKEELETALHQWYDEYDNLAEMIFKEWNLYNERKRDRNLYPQPKYSDYEDYRKYQQQVETIRRLEEADRRGMSAQLTTLGRLQQGLGRMQMWLSRNGYNYPWFKIRYSASDIAY